MSTDGADLEDRLYSVYDYARQKHRMPLPFEVIALEEHATFPALGDERPFYDDVWKHWPKVRADLCEHSDGRVADMDAAWLTVQVMSHLPGMSNERPAECRAANDEMAAAVKAHPTRFRGFAALPMAFPDQAARELERAVTELGFVGAMIDNHLEDMTHYDGERFWCVFEAAERLDVPLYIHPAPPSDEEVRRRFAGNYSDMVAMGLAVGAWGWHENVGLHVLKLYAAGVFEKFPKLKVVIGHMGELLPLMIARNDKLRFFNKAGLPKFSETWDRNIWVTSSGIFDVATLEMVLKVTKMERVMYSVDYPFQSYEEGYKLLANLLNSGSLSKSQIEMFASGNARQLLKI